MRLLLPDRVKTAVNVFRVQVSETPGRGTADKGGLLGRGRVWQERDEKPGCSGVQWGGRLPGLVHRTLAHVPPASALLKLRTPHPRGVNLAQDKSSALLMLLKMEISKFLWCDRGNKNLETPTHAFGHFFQDIVKSGKVSLGWCYPIQILFLTLVIYK